MAYAWGGSQAVAETTAALAPRYGAFVSSRKRPAWHPLSRSNPSSDHNEANRTAYAMDFATFNGAPLAHAVARHFGVVGYSTGNYTTYTLQRGGAAFRVQILWAVAGHFNHVHLGVRLIGGSYSPGPTRAQREARALKPLGLLQRRAAKTLLYRRRRRKAEGKTGRGRKWRRWNRLVGRSYRKVERLHRRASGARKAVFRRVLDDRDGQFG